MEINFIFQISMNAILKMEDVTTTVPTQLEALSAAVTLDMSWMMMNQPAMVSYILTHNH